MRHRDQGRGCRARGKKTPSCVPAREHDALSSLVVGAFRPETSSKGSRAARCRQRALGQHADALIAEAGASA